VPLTVAWKAAFAVVLVMAILASACARAPRRAIPAAELRRLVVCAVVLYAVGALASLSHHPGLAGLVFGAGISVAALAAWLSRGRDQEDPPDGGLPVDQQPPPEPDGVPGVDWARFEREFRQYARDQSPPTRVGGHDASGSTSAPAIGRRAPPMRPGPARSSAAGHRR
jgi:hypothetical protein